MKCPCVPFAKTPRQKRQKSFLKEQKSHLLDPLLALVMMLAAPDARSSDA
jgi:hypothetical protein